MKSAYRFTKRKGKPYIQVTFAHIPNKWFSTGTTYMSEAILWAEAKMREVDTNRKDITLKEFAKDFFTKSDPHGYRHRLEKRENEYEESFYEQHQARLDNYILKAHGSYLLQSLKDTLIEDFIIDIPNIANNTKNKILACYRIVLQEAVREGYIDRNPAKDVVMLPDNYESRESFTKEEMALLFPENDEELIQLWQSRENDGLKYAVYFLIEKDTGWRPSEVSALSKENYFPELHGIYTTCDVSWRTHTITDHIKTTKKGQKFKIGFLTEQTERLLVRLIAETYCEYLFATSRKLCKNRKDEIQFMYSEKANKRLNKVCEKANIDRNGRTQYCLRHTFNTETIGTIPEQARLILMGHRKYRPEYDHLTPQEKIKRVQDIIKKDSPN